MINHETSFAALHMTDHMPFYSTLPRQRLNLRDTLFRVVLSKNMDARFNSSLCNFKGLGFCHNDKADFIRSAITLASGVRDLIKSILVVFADGGNEVRHETIIIFPA